MVKMIDLKWALLYVAMFAFFALLILLIPDFLKDYKQPIFFAPDIHKCIAWNETSRYETSYDADIVIGDFCRFKNEDYIAVECFKCTFWYNILGPKGQIDFRGGK